MTGTAARAGGRSGPIATWAPLRAWNTLAARLPRLDRGLPTVEEAVAAATREVGDGPADLGNDSWRPGLEAFLTSLAGEADLTPAGRLFARRVVVSALVNRLRVHRALAADPRTAQRPVGPAIVVVGLPRSGTTLFQHLLSLDPDHRSLRHWEAASPAPSPGADAAADAQRIRAAQRGSWLVDRLAPDARVLHPTGPMLPTECVTLFVNSFASLELPVLYQVPGYLRWCLETDMRPHYAFYARQLQVLARVEQRARWALKSPAHLFWLEELTAALPESRVVVLHRDPLEVLSSFCGLVTLASSITARQVDPVAVGGLWSAVWAEGVRRAAVARTRIAPDRCVDVQYRDLVADPVGTVAGVYGAFGLPFHDRHARAVRDHVAAHPQRRNPLGWSLTDVGLDAAAVRRRFAEAAVVAGAPRGPER